MLTFRPFVFVSFLVIRGRVNAESHTISFTNNCGYGTPTLIGEGGVVLSTGTSYTSAAPIFGAFSYLQTGDCGSNAENCTMVETTLVNPTTAGSGSISDISLISPHTFSVASGFTYYNGCDGTGADCTSASCVTAFHFPFDNAAVACQADDVNLLIKFCD